MHNVPVKQPQHLELMTIIKIHKFNMFIPLKRLLGQQNCVNHSQGAKQ